VTLGENMEVVSVVASVFTLAEVSLEAVDIIRRGYKSFNQAPRNAQELAKELELLSNAFNRLRSRLQKQENVSPYRDTDFLLVFCGNLELEIRDLVTDLNKLTAGKETAKFLAKPKAYFQLPECEKTLTRLHQYFLTVETFFTGESRWT